ncbi:MAG: hypothetical protein WCG34_10400 [Leptolinea sp.]
MKPRTLKNFIIFITVGFGPVIFVYGILFFGLLVNIGITLTDISSISLQFALLLTLLLAFLIAGLLGSYYFFKKANAWLIKTFILYGFWFALIIIPIFLLFTSLAGASMAAVDGSLPRNSLLLASGQESLLMLLFAQLGIIPWVAGAVWVLNRIENTQRASNI